MFLHQGSLQEIHTSENSSWDKRENENVAK